MKSTERLSFPEDTGLHGQVGTPALEVYRHPDTEDILAGLIEK